MNKIKELSISYARFRRCSAKTLVLIALAAIVGGCYTPAAYRDFTRDGTVPWWCKGSPDLVQQECLEFSLSLDTAVNAGSAYPTLSLYTAAGATEIVDRPSDVGVAYTRVVTPSTFDPNAPNVLLYDGTTPESRLVGVAWEINDAVAPEGFAGARDVWTQNTTTGNWWLTAWIIRGYQNHPDVFAASHPCLTSTGSILTSTNDACYQAAHTEPFEILVTNDDGYAAAGIDTLVESLYGLTNVSVQVVAPFANQSGSSDQITKKPFILSASNIVTASGKPGTAISNTDLSPPRNGSGSPADAVLYGLRVMNLSPDIVLSGINQGQNIGPLSNFSGTVGAARTARRNGVPALATSQGGFTPPNDYPTGAAATLALLEEWRLGRTVNTTSSVLSTNIPTCAVGSNRGSVNTIVAAELKAGQSYTTQDCASTQTTIRDDIDAFNFGFISITDVGI